MKSKSAWIIYYNLMRIPGRQIIVHSTTGDVCGPTTIKSPTDTMKSCWFKHKRKLTKITKRWRKKRGFSHPIELCQIKI